MYPIDRFIYCTYNSLRAGAILNSTDEDDKDRLKTNLKGSWLEFCTRSSAMPTSDSLSPKA